MIRLHLTLTEQRRMNMPFVQSLYQYLSCVIQCIRRALYFYHG